MGQIKPSESLCRDQKFGHNFKEAGGVCVNCGISQTELSSNSKQKWSSDHEATVTTQNTMSVKASGQNGIPPHRAQSEEGGNGSVGRRIEYFKKKPEKGIHSETHALAKEVSEYCGEPKKFAMYLGVIKNMGLPRAYKLFSEIKQGKEIKTPGKLFLYLSSYRKPKNGKITRKIKNGNHKRTGKNPPEKVTRGRNNNARS